MPVLPKPRQLSLPGLEEDQEGFARDLRKAHQRNVLKQKILVGAYFLGESRRTTYHDFILECMSDYLTMEKDRALFGLPPKVTHDTSK